MPILDRARPTRFRDRLARRLTTAIVVAGVASSACRYTPLVPLGVTNDTRATAGAASRQWAEPLDAPGLPNLHRVSADLYRGAQPKAEGIEQLEKLGVRTIINLRASESDRRLLNGASLTYEHIPMTAWRPNDADVIQFLRIVGDGQKAPIFVHCQRGADRTGLMTAIYRIAVQGWSKEEAIAEMTQGGFGFYSGWQNLVRYLRDLDLEDLQRQAQARPIAVGR